MKAGMTKNTPPKILKKLLEIYGSQVSIARTVGLKKAAVSAWYANKKVPPSHINKLVKASNGALNYEDFYQ